MRTTWMSLQMKALSILCGFSKIITAYAFRHMAAKALDAAGGKATHRDTPG